jgi:hypothetical protein
MYTKFSPPSGNTGSSKALANYLDKEQQHGWFDHTKEDIRSEDVVRNIDQNGKGQLGKNDWKFIEVEYNPSHKEQQKIVELATGKKGVQSFRDLNPKEQQQVKDKFREFVRTAQDSQAKNYNRGNINSGADLKYYAKIETQRKYKGTDDAVINGQAKQGDLKEGLNMHAHIIQSRKAVDRTTKLSPVSKHRKQTDKNKIQQGFDRNVFAKKIEQDFDKLYGYGRDVKETLEYKKAHKNNDLEMKRTLMEQHGAQKGKPENKHSEQRNAREKFVAEQRGKSHILRKENDRERSDGNQQDKSRDRGRSNQLGL